jgi:poly(A) polymerase
MKLFISSRALSLLIRVSDFLTGRGVQSYLTGGFVRDALLKRATADIDIALADDALAVAPALATALGGRYVPLDEVNRVGRVVTGSQGAPSATGRWQIDLSTIRGDIENDLRQRDFTVGAIAADIAAVAGQAQAIGEQDSRTHPPERLHEIDLPLIDPSGGGQDLGQRVIRAVTETAFTADAIRLLRAVRLAAELGFTIEAETESLIRRYCRHITGAAAERVREEVLRLFAAPGSGGFVRYLDTLGLLTAIIPELAPLKGVKQPPEHFWDVLDHSLETVATTGFLLRQGTLEYATDQVLEVVPWSAALAEHFAQPVSGNSTRGSLLKLAALLHDIAKPETKTIHEDNRMRFLGHAQQGATTVAGILERLRFSAREIKLVAAEVQYHLRPVQMSNQGLPSRRAIYRYFRDTADAGIDTLYLSLADHLAARGPRLNPADWQEHARMVGHVLEQHSQEESLVVPPKLVDGHDLINVFGLSPGPRFGELLESLREAQAAGEVATREEAIAYISRRL